MTSDTQADGQADWLSPPELDEVIDRTLDKGVVIEQDVQLSVLDIGLLGVSSRVLIMSLERWWDLMSGAAGHTTAQEEAQELGPGGRHTGELKETPGGRETRLPVNRPGIRPGHA